MRGQAPIERIMRLDIARRPGGQALYTTRTPRRLSLVSLPTNANLGLRGILAVEAAPCREACAGNAS